MAVRTKPYFPLDLHSKGIDDGWVLPDEQGFARNLTGVSAPASTSTSTSTSTSARDAVAPPAPSAAQDGWGISVDAEAAEIVADSIRKVDVNRASLEELCEVPGIGPLRARRILSLREKNGQFGDVSDLSAVRGLGKKTLEQLRPHLTV